MTGSENADYENEAYQQVREFISDLKESGHDVRRVTVPQDVYDEVVDLADDARLGSEIDGVGLCYAHPDNGEMYGEVKRDVE